MVKPIALSMFKLNAVEYDEFIREVELRMLEETDYELELERSVDLSARTKNIGNIIFPTYYPEFSSPKILVMDWLEGEPLGEFLKRPVEQSAGNKIGQAMWDFYQFQMHNLHAVHADPHPGNFIIMEDNQLGIIDFGCVKVIPDDFYNTYFQLHDPELLSDSKKVLKVFSDLRFIYQDDSVRDRIFFIDLFTQLVELLGRPFQFEHFDFSDDAYFESLYSFGEKLSNMKELRESKRPRGVRDAIYINRTYFGIFNLLHDLGASVKVKSEEWEKSFV
jgi:predicted unusual protein kinase regulating ubiquinone biosynthesis (AarF/ABC1/UbiB family)